MRIQNFYKSKYVKLNLVTFQSVKEKQPSRKISRLQYNNEIVKDPDQLYRSCKNGMNTQPTQPNPNEKL
jgi:hypothetical protein